MTPERIAKLRDRINCSPTYTDAEENLSEALDEIERMRAVYSELLAAADSFANQCECTNYHCPHRDAVKAAVRAAKEQA